jgi:hypothetical protein
MTQFLKKNFVLLLAFLLPILLIIILALITYLPSLGVKTKYNFLYSTCTFPNNYNYYPYDCNHYLKQRYSVVDGKIKVNDIDPNQDLDKNGVKDINETYTARIFLHDTEKNESREISLKEAESLELNSLITSPDGLTISSSYDRIGDDFFIFGGGYTTYGYYLTKGKSRSRINLINNDDRYYYQNNFQFIGWVLPGRN